MSKVISCIILAQDLAPTVEELSSDNPLTPVGSPDRIENEDEELLGKFLFV